MNETNTLGEQFKYKYYHCPNSRNELEKLVNEFNQKGQTYYVSSKGNNWGYGCFASHQECEHHINLKELNQVISFDETNGIITLEPGVTYQILHDFLDKNSSKWIAPVHGGGPNCSVIGNILERGYGITPIMDHFNACRSLKAILPNGQYYESPLNSLGLHELANKFKYGIGPYLDGIFTQSNLGVITEMTVKLAKKPDSIELFFISIDESQLENAIELIRQLKTNLSTNIGGINLMNKERVLSMLVDYPQEKILNREPLDNKFIEEYSKKHMITDWTIAGAIYGPKEIVRTTKKLIKKELRTLNGRKVFLNNKKIKFLSKLTNNFPMLISKDIAQSINSVQGLINILNGIPEKTALKLAYWKSLSNKAIDNPQEDNCGLIWYAPLVEMDKIKVSEYINFVTTISRKYDFNPVITLTTIDETCFDSTIPIVFNKDDHKDQQRAHAYFNALLEQGYKLGFYPYRFGTNSMNHFFENTDHSYRDILATLKNSFDPQRLLADGRYISKKDFSPN